MTDEPPMLSNPDKCCNKYRTIVADPPWRFRGNLPNAPFGFAAGRGRPAAAYQTMTVDEIAALPVAELAAKDAHLYLWTTSRHLQYAWGIAEAWGFTYSTLLVWCKPPRGLVASATFTIAAEYVLFCRRGTLASLSRHDRNWFEWGRSNTHSAKPDAFLDLIEQVSPGPRLELFARRQRLGWDTWGNEALEHVQMETA